MEALSLSEYLNLDIKDKSNLDNIFHYADSFLNDLQKNRFPENKVSIIDSIIEKYVDCGLNILKESRKLEELLESSNRFKGIVAKGFIRNPIKIGLSFFSFKADSSVRYNNEFNKLYGLFISSYKKIIENRKYAEFEGYFNPNNTTKDKIKFLINKCVNLINNDETLKPRAKQKFIHEFETILRQLDSSYSNWTLILGKIKEVIFVMGALGGVATGAINIINQTNNLNIPKDQLEETVHILQKVEEEIVNSYQVTPDKFNETFTFGNRISMRTRNIEFVPLGVGSSDSGEKQKKDIPYTDFIDVEVINEEE